jgi:hypothetical protein
LDKNELDCDKSLKEGLGTRGASYETVQWWISAIKNGREETDNILRNGAPASVMDEHLGKQVKSVLEHVWSISYMQLLHKS